MLDGKAFGEKMVDIVRGFVERETRPLIEQIKALTDRLDAVESRDPVAATPDLEVIRSAVAEQVAALPPAQDGTSVTLDEIEPMIREAVAALPPAAPGKDVDMDAVDKAIAERVEAAIAAIPAPRDGADADMDVILRHVAERVEAEVAAIPVAKDGVGLAGALLDRQGDLVVTLSNGNLCNLGRAVGQDADMDALRAELKAAVEAIPKPRNGFELSDFETRMMPDGRTLELSFTQGDMTYTHELFFPVVLYRDVFKEGEEYQHGDAVTWGGSLWIAQRDTSAKPDGPDSGWRLSVKRGRDGKDADKKVPA